MSLLSSGTSGRPATCVLSYPAYYADERIDWQWVRLWMTQHSVPPVIAKGWQTVGQIDGVSCTSTVTELLQEIWRVMV